ncbi:pre-mRNA 3'-end-processing factor FIP1-like isoform X2 [Clytia hemisphaerica]|uniref:pre-mRNA 3'-end-processing factor FIP1-like isoform X2 n=1 Tax=Clytia hemisphaerica TaxID=252671 RepID=UPI0034D74124
MAATMVTAIPVSSAENVISNPNVAPEDDEKFLYGENSEKKSSQENGDAEMKDVNGNAGGEDEDEFEDSDDDDDDNIQVHIGEVNTANQFGTPTSNWKKDGQNATGAVGAPATGAVAAAAAAAAKPGTQLNQPGQKKIDVNAVGQINGQPIYEFDMDAEQDEKAWRKPGADISDYFNYGFTEETWKQYCEKQRRMRLESVRTPYTVTAAPPTVVHQAHPPAHAHTHTHAQPPQPLEFEVLPDGRTRVKAGPPPDRKVEGSIHVLGSDDARRKQKEDELLALALGQPRMIQQPFGGPRPIYTALPGGGMVLNENQDGQSQQPGQIQSMGAPSSMGGPVMGPSGVQYLPAGANIVPLGPGQMFPPGGPQDPFQPPQGFPPQFGGPLRGSDSEYDSEGELRRHRRRDSSGRHGSRRHRDRSDRGERDRDRSMRDRDRDRPRTEHRDRSSRRRHESRSTSDRKKHSRSGREEEEGGERKSSRRSRTKTEIKQEPIDNTDNGVVNDSLAPDGAVNVEAGGGEA